MRACTRAPAEAGQSMVEFALVGPMFLLLVIMILEGGLMMNAQASLDNATREAARAVAICGSSIGSTSYGSIAATGCQALAQNVAVSNLGLLAGNPPVLQVTQASGFGGGAAVTVQYSYAFYAPTFLGLGGPTITLSSTAPVIGQQ